MSSIDTANIVTMLQPASVLTHNIGQRTTVVNSIVRENVRNKAKKTLKFTFLDLKNVKHVKCNSDNVGS